ncbi:MAG: phosphate regulon sensor histidine kinase PhoR [Reinekea sp.]|jgi:two-component system, OmpR family, phosphate regulon sensor histidine kinase PhoR
MIRDLRRSHYRQLAAVLAISLAAGWFAGYPWLVLALGSTGYLCWILYQQHKLIHWLISGARATPPEAIGLWGVIFDHLYRMQREHRRQIRNYRDIVQRIRTSTEALNDGIIMLDLSGNIQWWNSAAQDLLRLRNEDMGQLLTNLVRDPAFIQFYNKSHHGDPITLDNPAHNNQFLQVAMTIFGKGERLLLLRDVTRLKQLEQMRQDFVANASHELKTPLTVLQGHLENILTFSDDLAAPMEKALNSMNNQTKRMANLVNDLLMLTRLDSTTKIAEGRPIDMPIFLQQIAEDARSLSSDKQQNVVVNCLTDAQLRGKPGDIRSAINNLVFNAVHYSPKKSTITITWQLAHSGAVLSVEDEGIGIDQHHIPRLTERFYRVDAGRSSDVGGTGLGLAIVKHTLHLHNARLDIRSEKNKGSIFSCVFPADRVIDVRTSVVS